MVGNGDPRTKTIYVGFKGFLSSDPGKDYGYFVDHKYLGVDTDNIYSILKHPNLKLDSFSVHPADDHEQRENLMDKLMTKMEGLNHKIHVESVDLECVNLKKEIEILKHFQQGTLKRIKIEGTKGRVETEDIEKVIDVLNENEHHKVEIGPNLLNADGLYSIPRLLRAKDILLKYTKKVLVKDATQIVQAVLQSPILHHCHIMIPQWRSIEKQLQRFGAKIVPGFTNVMHYPIPNSDDEFFEIFSYDLGRSIGTSTGDISMTRKQKS